MDSLPAPVSQKIQGYLSTLGARFTTVAPRKTCLGMWSLKKNQHFISINSDLQGVQFMLTLVHEIAHGYNWNKFGNTVKPHGQEWKDQYRVLMLPLLQGYFDSDIENTLCQYMNNPGASSACKIEIRRITGQGQKLVEDVPMGAKFKLRNGVEYQKIKKIRTRWSIADTTGKLFVVHGSAIAFF